MNERAESRLVRLLGMLGHLSQHGPADVTELADQFGVSEAQIREDVDLLWVSGRPGYEHGQLIDFNPWAIDDGLVDLTDAQGLTHPLRLAHGEATALVAALAALADAPAVNADPDYVTVVRSALDKVSSVVGDAVSATCALDVTIGHDADPAVLAVLTTGLSASQRLWLRYVNAADEVSTREVDPARLVTEDGSAYLIGWCYSTGMRRTFRVDRILEARLLPVAVDLELVELALVSGDVDVAASAASDPDAAVVTLTLAPSVRWLSEQLTTESVRDFDNGTFAVSIRVTDDAWFTGLLLAIAPHVIDVDPPGAANAAANAAREALVAYKDR